MAKMTDRAVGRWTWRAVLLAGTGGLMVSAASPAAAAAQVQRTWAIPAQGLGDALRRFGLNAGRDVAFDPAAVAGKTTRGVTGKHEESEALRLLLDGTGLDFRRTSAGYAIAGQAAASAPQAAEPASTADIVVTAQKRTERIQDVPIAISAFSGDSLNAQKIETGGDLLKAIPNVTFSKNNFTSYNFAIRGIGTKAVSVSTDPAVAIAFNSSNLLVNRLFEQEFYDIERVEVLRGPQGTLYGRNATAGVVNIISNKAKLDRIEGFYKLEVGNYETARVSGAINIPIIADKLAIRAAGAYTNRDGFAYNELYDQRIDGRNLWSTRVTVSARPFDALTADFIWEHFNENDDRQRTGKQLCHKDPGPASIAGQTLTEDERAQLSQGCLDGPLYGDGAYETPNGRSLNAYQALRFLNNNIIANGQFGDPTLGVDPYGNLTQSRDLRRFAAVINPRYKAKADVFEANLSLDLGKLSIISQTVYNKDRFYSTQDYNRYASVPIFKDTTTIASPENNFAPGGFYTDPQLGRSNLFVGGDLVRSRSKQFSQEVRVQSNDPTSRLQYVVGGNYTDFKILADYSVFINTLSYASQYGLIPGLGGCNELDANGQRATTPGVERPVCVYIDPNPIGTGPADGHNYFRSVNPYKLKSYGVFGDANFAILPSLKIIGGLRGNFDRKEFNRIPSQLLLSTQAFLAGFVDRGYPSIGQVEQGWDKLTGRAGLQWTPDLSFTDKTMAYFTYSRGYKAGGANPPGVGFGTTDGPSDNGFARGQILGTTFEPEYINAYELGVKNTLFGGKVTFDATAFYYDYKDYQVSQIVDRSAQNENFDARVWGLEFEAVADPFRNLRLNANLGYQRTRIASGERSIDVLNRTQGRAGYYVVKPFVQLPSNCVASEAVVERALNTNNIFLNGNSVPAICQGTQLFSDPGLIDPANYPGTGFTVEDLYPNGGKGFFADLSHNELPNAPRLTFNIGAQYTVPIGNDWGVIARGDFYRQSASWARVYNVANDRLHAWKNTNASLRLGNERLKVLIEFYVKNVFNAAPITDAFVNSDDTGLPTNVFTLDPRTIGLNITKGF